MPSKRNAFEVLIVALIVFLFLQYFDFSPTTSPSTPKTEMFSFSSSSSSSSDAVSYAVSHLTADFLHKVAEAKEGENLFFSAFSLSSALSMTAVGARGNTQKEMLETLHLKMDPSDLAPAYGSLLHGSKLFNNPSGPIQLNNANRLWIEKSFPIHQAYVDATQKHFDASAEPTDFMGNAESERLRINHWVEKQTNDKIKDLIPAGGVDSSTPLVLTNAIYFKANWVRRFEKNKSQKGDFTLLNKEKTQVTYMYDKYKLPYTHQGDFSAIEKNYTSPSGKTLSMVFMLPEDHGVEGLKKTIAALKPPKGKSIPHFLTQLHETEVPITIPRFKLEFEIEASKVLKDLGMKDAFSNADFSGISSHPLTIGQVFHKAFVDVNEEGTEAAAATAVVMLRMAAMGPKPTFHAIRPFLFLIWDRPSGLILFTGLVAKPPPQ